MASDEPIHDLVVAMKLAGERKRIARCLPMVREHVQLLEAGDRHGDAAFLVGSVLLAGGNPGELDDELLRLAAAAWGEEPWWSSFTEIFGLLPGTDLRGPWKGFSRAVSFRAGSLLFHPGGWGVGEVTDVKPEEPSILVKFWNGRTDEFPMLSATEIFEPVGDQDVRARYYREPAECVKWAKKEPLEVLRTIALQGHGIATTTTARNAMAQIGIEGSAWSAWWRKARKLIETSEWFEMNGSNQKATIKLLLVAKDPAASLRRQLDQATSATDVFTRVRDILAGTKVEDSVREVACQALETVAEDTSQSIPDRIVAWLLLREQRGESAPGLIEMLRDFAAAPPPEDPAKAPLLWECMLSLPVARDQERAVDVLPEVLGEAWIDDAAKNLPHAGAGMVRPLVDALNKAGREDDLLAHYAGLLARPLRAPALLVTLARVFEGKTLPPEFASAPQRVHALLTLASHLNEARRGNAFLTRVHQRLADLLTGGSDPLLKRLLAESDAATLRSLQTVLARGVDPAIDGMMTEIALDKDRHFFAHELTPFWQSAAILTTRSGLERRSAELHELREEKIPANQEAIGRAASFGDLSENSEWEAAIAEQRTLTQRAMEIEEELRSAELIENAALPEDTACPGARVRYKDLSDGSLHQIEVLGPWDDHLGEDVVSYRAPLAAGLLGKRPGEEATLDLPKGQMQIEVVSVEPLELT